MAATIFCNLRQSSNIDPDHQLSFPPSWHSDESLTGKIGRKKVGKKFHCLQHWCLLFLCFYSHFDVTNKNFCQLSTQPECDFSSFEVKLWTYVMIFDTMERVGFWYFPYPLKMWRRRRQKLCIAMKDKQETSQKMLMCCVSCKLEHEWMKIILFFSAVICRCRFLFPESNLCTKHLREKLKVWERSRKHSQTITRYRLLNCLVIYILWHDV